MPDDNSTTPLTDGTKRRAAAIVALYKPLLLEQIESKQKGSTVCSAQDICHGLTP